MNEKHVIRKLKRKDRVTLSAMIVKLTTKIGDAGLLTMIARGQAGASATATDSAVQSAKNAIAIDIGIQVVKMMVTHLEDDISAWFASLLAVTVEELNEMDPDVELDIIAQLKSATEIKDFFSKASQLYSGTPKSESALPATSMPSGSVTP